jgi:hypothetical protein
MTTAPPATDVTISSVSLVRVASHVRTTSNAKQVRSVKMGAVAQMKISALLTPIVRLGLSAKA